MPKHKVLRGTVGNERASSKAQITTKQPADVARNAEQPSQHKEKPDREPPIRGQLGLLKLYVSLFKSQRDAIDRWFVNYLRIIAAPLPLVVSLLQLDAIKGSIPIAPIIAIVTSFFFGIGVLFLFMHIRQRINSLRHSHKIFVVERIILEQSVSDWKKKIHTFKPEPYGADFWVGTFYIVINAMWLSTGIYFSVRPRLIWIIGTFALGSSMQAVGRHILLRKSQNAEKYTI